MPISISSFEYINFILAYIIEDFLKWFLYISLMNEEIISIHRTRLDCCNFLYNETSCSVLDLNLSEIYDFDKNLDLSNSRAAFI